MSINIPRSVCITGGTGSLGTKLSEILANEIRWNRIVIYSRDWHKQETLRKLVGNSPKFRWFLGDVSDRERLTTALQEVDCVIHAAALKSVPDGEYNPSELSKINISGTEKVIQASIEAGVSKVMVVSSDKCCHAVNSYGKSKAMAESLAVGYNSYTSGGKTKIAVSRYGNVINSSGSVIPIFTELAKANIPIGITGYQMTRFWITLEDAAKFVLRRLDDMQAGEIYIPKIKAASVYDVVQVIREYYSSTSDTYEMGIRPGEKLHEILFSVEEARHTYEIDDYYCIFPEIHLWDRNKIPRGKLYSGGIEYSSYNAMTSRGELRKLIYG